jgi:hypothetical protein
MDDSSECWALEARSLSSKVIVVPNTLAAAYIPQLACDLLIENLALPYLGAVRVPQLLPFAGRGSYSHTPSLFLSSAELYGNQEVAVLQQRAPIARGRSEEHAHLFWRTFGGRGRVLFVLNSINAAARESSRVLTAPLSSVWYLANPAGQAWIATHSAPWFELDEADVSPLFWPLSQDRAWLATLFERAAPEDALVVLQMFAHSGDNRNVALLLAQSLASTMNWVNGDWKAPPTWHD